MTINPSIIYIPTTYKGVRFRSRLEAKWAAFFDLLEWQWTYEPYDLGGWTPDFAIKGFRGDILVEVKPLPCASYSSEYDKSAMHEIADTHDILLLGHSPELINRSFYIGLCNDEYDGHHLTKATVGLWEGQKIYGYCSDEASYTDRITGEYDGSNGGSSPSRLMENWGVACSAVQWRGK